MQRRSHQGFSVDWLRAAASSNLLLERTAFAVLSLSRQPPVKIHCEFIF